LFGIACTFEPTGDPGEVDHRLPDEAPTHLFRIAQEAVSNAVRHGQARHVHITLMRAPDRLRLVVRDDGTGFPALVRSAGSDRLDERTLEGPAAGAAPARPHDNRGMGVRIMHYRARILGGALGIRPFAKGGTIVTCTEPGRRASALTLTPADEDAHPLRCRPPPHAEGPRPHALVRARPRGGRAGRRRRGGAPALRPDDARPRAGGRVAAGHERAGARQAPRGAAAGREGA